MAALQMKCDGLSSSSTTRCRVLKKPDTATGDLEEELAKAKALTAEIERKLEQARKSKTTATRGNKTKRQRIAELEADLKVARAEAARLRDAGAASSATQQKLSKKRSELKACRDELDKMRAELKVAEASVKQLELEAQQAKQETEKLLEQVQEEQAKRGATQDALNDLRARMAETNPAGPAPPAAPTVQPQAAAPAVQPRPTPPAGAGTKRLRSALREEEARRAAVQDALNDLRVRTGQAGAVRRPVPRPRVPRTPGERPSDACESELARAHQENYILADEVERLSRMLPHAEPQSDGMLMRLTELFSAERRELASQVMELERMKSKVTDSVHPDTTSIRRQIDAARQELRDLERQIAEVEHASPTAFDRARSLDGLGRRAFTLRRRVHRVGEGITRTQANVHELRTARDDIEANLRTRIGTLEDKLRLCEEGSRIKENERLHLREQLARLSDELASERALRHQLRESLDYVNTELARAGHNTELARQRANVDPQLVSVYTQNAGLHRQQEALREAQQNLRQLQTQCAANQASQKERIDELIAERNQLLQNEVDLRERADLLDKTTPLLMRLQEEFKARERENNALTIELANANAQKDECEREQAALQQQITRLQQALASQSTGVDYHANVAAELEKKERQLAELKQKYNAFDQLSKLCSATKEKEQQLEQDLAERLRQLREAQSHNGSLQDQVKALQSHNEQLNKMHQRTLDLARQRNADIAGLDAKIQSLREKAQTDADAHKSEIEGWEKSLKESADHLRQENKKTLDAELKTRRKVEQQLVEANKKLVNQEQLTRELREMSRKNVEAEAKLNSLQQEREAHDKVQQGLQNEVQELQNTNQQLVEQRNEALERAKVQVREAEEDKNTKDEENLFLQQELNRLTQLLETQQNQFKTENEQLKSERSRLENELNDTRQQLQTQNEVLEDLQQSSRANEDKLADLQSERKVLLQELKTLQNDNTTKTRTLDETKAANEALQAEKTRVEGELDQLQREHAEVKQSHAAVSTENIRLRDETENIQRDLARQQQEIEQKKGELGELQTRMERLAAENAEKQNLNENLEDLLETQDLQMQELIAAMQEGAAQAQTPELDQLEASAVHQAELETLKKQLETSQAEFEEAMDLLENEEALNNERARNALLEKQRMDETHKVLREQLGNLTRLMTTQLQTINDGTNKLCKALPDNDANVAQCNALQQQLGKLQQDLAAKTEQIAAVN